METNDKTMPINEETKTVPAKKINKKKLFIILGAIAFVIILSAVLIFSLVCFHEWEEATCTKPITCVNCGMTQGKPLNETDFMNSLARGLEERWKLTEADEEKEITTKSDWEGYFNAEYSEISKFETANFENQNLSKLAKQYVACIIKSKECLPYVNTNQWDSKYSNGVYQDRVELLYEINAIIPIPVSEENQESLSSLLTDGEVTHMVRNLLTTIKFEQSKDEYGWKTYEAIAENSTTIDFSYFAFNVDLVDSKGVTLTTATAYVDNWRSGEKSRFTFDTSEEFETMNLESASWSY